VTASGGGSAAPAVAAESVGSILHFFGVFFDPFFSA